MQPTHLPGLPPGLLCFVKFTPSSEGCFQAGSPLLGEQGTSRLLLFHLLTHPGLLRPCTGGCRIQNLIRECHSPGLGSAISFLHSGFFTGKTLLFFLALPLSTRSLSSPALHITPATSSSPQNSCGQLFLLYLYKNQLLGWVLLNLLLSSQKTCSSASLHKNTVGCRPPRPQEGVSRPTFLTPGSW